MTMKHIYKGVEYNSREELRKLTGLSRKRINAKIKDKEILLPDLQLNTNENTGDQPYDNNQQQF